MANLPKILSVLSIGILLPYVWCRQKEPAHRVTSCLKTGGQLQVTCPDDQKVEIQRVAYAPDPIDCSNPIRDNDCIQASKILTDAAVNNCNGKPSCTVPVAPLMSDRRLTDTEGLQPSPSGCSIGGSMFESTQINYMLVDYDCIEYNFCDAIDIKTKDLRIKTKGFPEVSVTNPTCECTFSTEKTGLTYIFGQAECNGTVMFVAEETLQNGTVQVYEYECIDQMLPVIFQIGFAKPVSVKLTVDADQSSEYSSYRVFWIHASLVDSKRQPLATEVSCSKGSLYLTKTVRTALYVTIPLGILLLLGLTILYCVCKSRRRRAKEWRAKNVPLTRQPQITRANSSLEDVVVQTKTKQISRSSSLGSVKKNRDERTDPEGDNDEVGEYAAMLARQYEERRIKELEKRMNYNHPYSAATLAAVRPDRLSNNYRSHSVGNLRGAKARAAPEDYELEERPLASSKSASQSRASVNSRRSSKRQAPQPPASRAPLYAEAQPMGRGATPVRPLDYPPPPPHEYMAPYKIDNPYATPSITPSSEKYPRDMLPSNGSDSEDMTIMRPNKPIVPQKPRLYK